MVKFVIQLTKRHCFASNNNDNFYDTYILVSIGWNCPEFYTQDIYKKVY